MPHAGPFWHGDSLKIDEAINRTCIRYIYIYNRIYNLVKLPLIFSHNARQNNARRCSAG